MVEGLLGKKTPTPGNGPTLPMGVQPTPGQTPQNIPVGVNPTAGEIPLGPIKNGIQPTINPALAPPQPAPVPSNALTEAALMAHPIHQNPAPSPQDILNYIQTAHQAYMRQLGG